MLNSETINNLIAIYKDDEKMLSIIERAIMSFEEYHQAIFKMELWLQIHTGSVSADEYKDNVSKLDKGRSSEHNSVLGNVNLLNRLAVKNELPLAYDGKVSHKRPYRREVANAVLEYVEQIIHERR